MRKALKVRNIVSKDGLNAVSQHGEILPAIVTIDFRAAVRLSVFWKSEVGEGQWFFLRGA